MTEAPQAWALPQTRGYYDRLARYYDLLSRRSEAGVRRLGRRMLAVRPEERVLELGFGTGHSLTSFARKVGPGGRVLGLDLSGEMVRRTRALARQAGLVPRCLLVQGDACRLPFKGSCADAAFLCFLLETFSPRGIRIVLDECRRALRAGGRIAVVSLGGTSRRTIGWRLWAWLRRRFLRLLDCRPIAAREALARAGFQILQVRRRHTGWLPVEVVLGRRP